MKDAFNRVPRSDGSELKFGPTVNWHVKSDLARSCSTSVLIIAGDSPAQLNGSGLRVGPTGAGRVREKMGLRDG